MRTLYAMCEEGEVLLYRSVSTAIHRSDFKRACYRWWLPLTRIRLKDDVLYKINLSVSAYKKRGMAAWCAKDRELALICDDVDADDTLWSLNYRAWVNYTGVRLDSTPKRLYIRGVTREVK